MFPGLPWKKLSVPSNPLHSQAKCFTVHRRTFTWLLWLVGRLGTVNRFNNTSWMAVVTPTDRPKSDGNLCVIEVFGGVFVLSIGC